MLNVSYSTPNTPTEWTLLDDQELWCLFVQGDADVFAFIYDRFADDLFNYGMKVKHNRSLIKDCIHDLFVDLWRQRNNLSVTNNIKYYLFRALRRRIIYLVDREKKMFEDPLDDGLDGLQVGISVSIENEIINRQSDDERNRKLIKVLSKLSERQREVIELIFFKHMTYEEVSEIMSINVRSVYTLTWKAVTAAKKHLVGLAIMVVTSLS